MRFYRCWVGTKHEAICIPDGADDDTLLQFHCDCMGSIAMAPPVIEAVARNPALTLGEARFIAENWRPPRNPVVRVGDLASDDDSDPSE